MSTRLACPFIRKLFHSTAIVIVALCLRNSAVAAKDDLLDTLQKKGYLSPAEVKQLRASSVEVKAKSKNVVDLSLSGQLQIQYDYISADRTDYSDVNMNDAVDSDDTFTKTTPEKANHIYLRRIKLQTKATLSNDWYGLIKFQLSGSDKASLDKFYMGRELVSSQDHKHNFMIGYRKVPFGLEETTSSSKIKAIERSIVNRYFIDDIKFGGKHLGLYMEGNAKTLNYSMGLSNSNQGPESRPDGDVNKFNEIALWLRLGFSQVGENGNFSMGIDYGAQPQNSDLPADANGDYAEVRAWTAYAKLEVKKMTLQAEYFKGDIEAGGISTEPSGYALMISCRVNSLEPVLRYSKLDSDGTQGFKLSDVVRRAPSSLNDLDGLEEVDSIYGGFNYYILKRDLRLSAGIDYVSVDPKTSTASKAKLVLGRVQLQFLL